MGNSAEPTDEQPNIAERVARAVNLPENDQTISYLQRVYPSGDPLVCYILSN